MPDDGLLRWLNWDWGALVLRLVLGIIFIAHGSQKVFGAFGGSGPGAFTEFVKSLGFHPIFAVLSMFAELGGGSMVLLGILTEAGALLIAINMAVAIYKIHWRGGFFLGQGPVPGYEYNLLIIAVCLALILGGPGRFALWNPLRRG